MGLEKAHIIGTSYISYIDGMVSLHVENTVCWVIVRINRIGRMELTDSEFNQEHL